MKQQLFVGAVLLVALAMPPNCQADEPFGLVTNHKSLNEGLDISKKKILTKQFMRSEFGKAFSKIEDCIDNQDIIDLSTCLDEFNARSKRNYTYRENYRSRFCFTSERLLESRPWW